MKRFVEHVHRIWPVGFIIVIWFIFSAPYFFKGLVPFPSDYLVSFFPPWNAQYGMPVKNNAMPDVITQIFPWKKFTFDTWKSGNVPLWNPYSFSGTPHAANYQSAVFSPVNLLFFILPFLDAWSLMVLLQPLIAAIGMYILLTSLSRSSVATIVGAVGFMFSGFMTTWMAYGTLGWAVAFLPWALWGVNRSPFVVAAAIALSFLSGHFQISVYVLAATILYIFYRKKLSLFLFILAGLLLAAPQLLLAFDAYQASTRTIAVGKIEVIPWQYLITIIIPDFFGNPVTRNDWFGHYAEWSSYTGVIPFLLGILALLKRGKDGRLFFVLLGTASLLLAFPTPVNDVLYRLNLPVLSTSASGRVIVLVSFAIAALSAYGLDDVIVYWKTRKTKILLWFAVVGIFGFGILWLFLLAGSLFPTDKLIIAKRNSLLPTALGTAGFALILLGIWRRRFVKEVVLLGLLVILAFDSYRYVTKWMPFEERAYVYPDVESVKFLSQRIGNDRVFGNIGNEASGLFGLPIIEGYDAMYQGRFAEFINAGSTGQPTSGGRSVVQFDRHGQYKTNVLKLLGVRYIYHRISDGTNIWAFPYWEYGTMKIIYNDGKYSIYEYTDSYPRAFLASSYTVITEKSDIIQTLFDQRFDSRETLVLEEKPDFEPAKGEGSAQIVSYKPTNVTIRTSSGAPKLLFLSDVYDPGWYALVDGTKTSINRADYDFRAVAVPAGEHIIEFKYFPSKLTFALLLSGSTLLLLLVGSLWNRNHEHRHI